ncbi:MAG: CBS domain-containing protein [Gemmatimonadota bacterium]
MLRISRIMTSDVIAVSPDLGLRDAMELFVNEHVSGAPVIDGKKVVGVVTLSDMVTLAASTPGAPTLRAEVSEPGADEPVEPYVEGDDSVAAYFTEYWDDAGADAAERAASPDAPEWNALEELTVRDAMTEEVLHLPPDTEVTKAAEFMQRHRVHRVLIMEGGKLEGILSTSDIARAVAEHQLSDRRFVFGTPQMRGDGSWW